MYPVIPRLSILIIFLQDVIAFDYRNCAAQFSLQQLNPEDTCTLSHVVAPLQSISALLQQQVVAEQDMIHRMFLTERVWTLLSSAKSYSAKNVILATGAVPSSLSYPGVNTIPFDIAIDKQKLAAAINLDETYAVFGSSHSAIIIVRYLVELGVKKVINFYRSPCRYAVEMEDWILLITPA